MPAMTLMRVVLPQPLGPTSIINSPHFTSRSIPRSAVTLALPVPYVLVTPRACTATQSFDAVTRLLSYSIVALMFSLSAVFRFSFFIFRFSFRLRPENDARLHAQHAHEADQAGPRAAPEDRDRAEHRDLPRH